MPKIRINQEPPVCPGCRKTIGNVDVVMTDVFVNGEKGKMIAVCCANKGCGMVLPVDVRAVDEKNETKLVSLN